jgi:hypothetical protein
MLRGAPQILGKEGPMPLSTTLGRVPGLRVLLLCATVSCALLFGPGPNTAAAHHLEYCGNTHSGGYSHGSPPGDYWWSQFIGHTEAKGLDGQWYDYFHYIQWFHDRRGNHYEGDYWKVCGFGTPV